MKSSKSRAVARHLATTAVALGVLMLATTAVATPPEWGGIDLTARGSEVLIPDPEVSRIVTRDTATDPVGDTFGAGATQIDITSLGGEGIGGDVVITATFDGVISPPDSGEANAVTGFIDIDADQNGATGDVPWVDFLTGNPTTGMGNEFYVDIFSYTTIDGLVEVVDDQTDEVVGAAPASFTGNSMTVRIPVALLDGAGMGIDIAAVLGTVAEPTDIAPNNGSVAVAIPEPSPCGMSPVSSLLNDSRFEVSVEWSALPDYPDARPACVSNLRTDDSVNFYFLDPHNLEFLIKVLDGCTLNDHYWVFFAGTTNVDFTVTVTDTQEGVSTQYTNPQFQPADAVTDTTAFATCP